MKRVVLALDVQDGLSTPEVIIREVNILAGRYPTIATVLTQDPNVLPDRDWLDWKAPKEDSSLVNTKFQYFHHNYQLPPIVLKTLEKNGVEEVLVTGAARESFLLAAGFELFNAGFRASMVAPLCLTGQYHQHTVTMKIWESSIGKVYEDLAEIK